MPMSSQAKGLFERAIRDFERLARWELERVAIGISHWLADLWPRLPCYGCIEELERVFANMAREQVFIEPESRAAWIAWLSAANEAAQRAVGPKHRPSAPRPRFEQPVVRPADERHFPDDKPSPLDPEYPQLRRLGNSIMQAHPPDEWGDRARAALKNFVVPEEIAQAFVGWLERARRAAGVVAGEQLAMDEPPEAPAQPGGEPSPARPEKSVATTAFTEDEARAILTDEIKRWRGNGWNLAANLLQHFLDKKGPVPYTPTAADLVEVRRQSRAMVEKAVYRAIWNDATINAGNLKGAQIKFDEKVRWMASGFDESIPGAVYESNFSDLSDPNDSLFYAFGGAQMKVDGIVTKAGAVNSPVKSYIAFDVDASVAVSDDYTFEPTSSGWRLWIKTYAAANALEMAYGYKPFKVNVAFGQTYTRLRSDKIAGGVFHRDRPVPSGRPIPGPYLGE